VVEILNIQPHRGKAKAYQVKQVRGVLTSYGLAGAIEVEDLPMPEDSNEGKNSTKTKEVEGG
jgi:hypothetical protein